MRTINLLAVSLISVLLGCTSIRTDESSSTKVVIRDHFITGSGYDEVMSQARNYCQQYGAKPVFIKKQDSSFLRSEYNYYYFDCVKDQPYIPPYKPSYAPPAPIVTLDDAKAKCTNLGFKSGTEGFGKCVLQLSK
jgi:hypothetical protein